MRVQYDEDTAEKAYLGWKECGYNARKAARRLAAEGLVIHRNTISAWRDRCGWKTRALREQKEGTTMKEANRDDTGLIAGLEAQRKRYEGFFETLGPTVIDVQATYAYTAVVKAIADVHKKMDPKLETYCAAPAVMEAFVKSIHAKAETLDKAFVHQVFNLIDTFFEEIEPQ